MTIKRVGFISKRPDIGVDQFREHWLSVHAPLVIQSVNPKRYRINLIDKSAYPDAPYDGFAELWLPDTFDASAFRKDGEIVADGRKFIGAITTVHVEETPIVG